jgi:uncharacterized protein YndB with AHSA1/START domain
MPTVAASRELLASREDVWAFLAQPERFADWWPDIGVVQPDRRGLAPGARWQIRGRERPRLVRRPEASGVMLILEVEPPRRLTWQLTGDRIDVELELEETAPERTRATLAISAPWLTGLRRSFAVRALGRLHALCQTGAES